MLLQEGYEVTGLLVPSILFGNGELCVRKTRFKAARRLHHELFMNIQVQLFG